MRKTESAVYVDSIDPGSEWWKSPPVLGWLARVRGIILSVATGGASTTVTGVLVDSRLGFALGGLLVACLGGLLAYRRHRLKRINSDFSLHALMHRVRDRSSSVLRSSDRTSLVEALASMNHDVAQLTAQYFRKLLADPTINAALRLAETQDGKEAYITRGRSDGMEPSRESRTQPIYSSEGLAKALREKARDGVFIIYDIPTATSEGIWKHTDNDHFADVKTLMVAPINAWEDGRESMVGILYVTSRHKKYEPCDTTPLRAIADYLGLTYPTLLAAVACREGTGNG